MLSLSPTIILAQNLSNARDTWSGHIALPGGRQEAGESIVQTAVRECYEEIGVSLVPRQVHSVAARADGLRCILSIQELTCSSC